MKKIFAILTLTSIMVSCNDGGGAEDQKGDSTATASPATDAVTTDTSAAKLDSAAKPVDSAATGKPADTLKK